MKGQLRDTVFGHTVRLLSSNQLFRFPDEVDPDIWKHCLQKDGSTAASTSGEPVEVPRATDFLATDSLHNSTSARAVDDLEKVHAYLDRKASCKDASLLLMTTILKFDSARLDITTSRTINIYKSTRV
jgi:hypothetical protein